MLALCGARGIRCSRGPAQRLARANLSSQKPKSSSQQDKHTRTAYAMGTVVIFVFGLSYASVPLYKAFCKMTGFGGTTQRADEAVAATVKPVEGGRIIRINFNGTVHSNLPWTFRPTQRDVKVVPGETALAFYTVHNTSDKTITGVGTVAFHLHCICFC